MSGNPYPSAKAFLEKMDAGDLDGEIIAEVQKLTPEQQDELIRLLLEREGQSSRSAHG